MPRRAIQERRRCNLAVRCPRVQYRAGITVAPQPCVTHTGIGGFVLSSRNLIFAAAIAAVASLSTAPLNAQAAATICKDGTPSVSSGRGACSGHGGVNKKALKHQKKGAKAEVKPSGDAGMSASATSPKVSAKARARGNSNSGGASGSGAAEDNNPAGALARCKDGLYSHARNRRGACSRHGGVASWL